MSKYQALFLAAALIDSQCGAQIGTNSRPKAIEPVVALTIAEKEAIAELDLSFSHIRGYDFKAAKISLIKARGALPNNPVLLNNLGLIFAIEKDFANAGKLLAGARSNARDLEVKTIVFQFAPPDSGVITFFQTLTRASPSSEIAGQSPGFYAVGSGSLVQLKGKNQKSPPKSFRIARAIGLNIRALDRQGSAVFVENIEAPFIQGLSSIGKSPGNDWLFSPKSLYINRTDIEGENQINVSIAYSRPDVEKIYNAVKSSMQLMREGRKSENAPAGIQSEYKTVTSSQIAGFIDSLSKVTGYIATDMQYEAQPSWHYRVLILDSASSRLGSLVVSHSDAMDLVNGKVALSDQIKVAKIYILK